MSWDDLLRASFAALAAQRGRSTLTLLGIAVGIAAVLLLTSIGEGVHRFVLGEFTQFGTNVIEVTPGRTTTGGAAPGLPTTVRPLLLTEARALGRLPDVEAVTPLVWGNSEVEGAGRLRRTTVYGVGPQMLQVFRGEVRAGRFLPADDDEGARAFVVLGAKMRQELFGQANPLGARVRIGGLQFRVIGVLEARGQVLGNDLDDTAFIPAARAMELYGRDGAMQINVAYRAGAASATVAQRVRALLRERHGSEDFTVTTQEEALSSLSDILDILTLAVGALGGISLLVGGVGIVTVMTIAVTERTPEIGLMIALGARRRTVQALFLGEAVALAAAGGAAGALLGGALVALLSLAAPELPVHTPWHFVLIAELVSVVIGLTAGVLPARRAAALDPVSALRAD